MIRSGPAAAVIALAVAGVAAAQPALTAAAGTFKMLSEAAFAGTESAIAAAAARAEAAAAGVRPALPPGAARDLEAQLQALEAARRARDRSGIALASAEAYRILASLSDRTSKIPAEVRLLDYARLRFKADTRAAPPRWDDARDAVAFARARWAPIAPRVTTGSLRIQVDKALDDLDAAAGDRDPIKADQASDRFLDLTHQLEAYFAAL
jgi:hypothetical protein